MAYISSSSSFIASMVIRSVTSSLAFILLIYLRWHVPSTISLVSAVFGSQEVHESPFLVIACLARRRSVTVSAFNLLVYFVLVQLTWENMRSTQADEWGSRVKLPMNSESIPNLGWSSLSFTVFNECQNSGMLFAKGIFLQCRKDLHSSFSSSSVLSGAIDGKFNARSTIDWGD